MSILSIISVVISLLALVQMVRIYKGVVQLENALELKEKRNRALVTECEKLGRELEKERRLKETYARALEIREGSESNEIRSMED